MKKPLLASVILLMFLIPSLLSAQQAPDEINAHIIQKIDRAKAARLFEKGLLKAPDPTLNQGQFDVLHYTLDMAINDSTQYLAGTVTITLKSLADDLQSVDINADPILSISSMAQPGLGGAPWSRSGDVLSVELAEALFCGDTTSIEIDFGGYAADAPNPGIFFRNYEGMPVIYSLSEPWSARSWWPCKDYPDDKATFDLYFSVPSYLTAASNGDYLGYTEEVHWGRTFRRYAWRENNQMATYLASISAGDYVRLDDYWEYAPGESMLITDYVQPSKVAAAEEDLDIAVPALDFLSSIYGLYPFHQEKYGVALCNIGGGMEHQTLTSYGIGMVRGDHYYDWIYIHELGHQWFGNLITCEGWEDIWLNEGWASYTEALWFEHLGGSPALKSNMLKKDTQSSWNGPVYRDPGVNDPNYFFDLVVYHKAAWILHMFRHIAGDAAFFDMIQGYTSDARFRFSTANTEQFIQVCEDCYGGPLDWFFDPWLHRTDRPDYNWSWKCYAQGLDTLLSIGVTQQQSYPYTMPVDFRITTAYGKSDTTLWIDQREESFLIPVGTAVTSVELDPDAWVLCYKSGGVTDTNLPPVTYLSQNYPNPFNPATTIEFGIEEPTKVKITVYDAAGRLVKILADRVYSAGSHRVTWNGTGSKGNRMSSGLYFYRMESGNAVITKKMVLLR